MSLVLHENESWLLTLKEPYGLCLKVEKLWDVMSGRLVYVGRRMKGARCLHLQGFGVDT